MNGGMILVKTICIQYEVEPSFIESLTEHGLIQIQTIEDENYIESEILGNFERMVRLYHDLNINFEGIDVILNLMEKVDHLSKEITSLRNRLHLLEE